MATCEGRNCISILMSHDYFVTDIKLRNILYYATITRNLLPGQYSLLRSSKSIELQFPIEYMFYEERRLNLICFNLVFKILKYNSIMSVNNWNHVQKKELSTTRICINNLLVCEMIRLY